MLRVKKNSNYNKDKNIDEYELYFNKELYKGVKIYQKENELSSGLLFLEVNDEETANKLKTLPLHAFTAFEKIIFNKWNRFNLFSLEIDRSRYKDGEGTYVVFSIKPDLIDLEQKYDPVEYQKSFESILTQEFSRLSLKIRSNVLNDSNKNEYFTYHEFRDRPLNIEFKKYEIGLTNTHKKSVAILSEKEAFSEDVEDKPAEPSSEEKSFLTSFDFPEEIRIPCEQYLLYFAQFLQDLGVNTTSSLEEKAGKVLFSITPTDDAEALGKIREALAIYLNLPSSPIIYDESFAAMGLQRQVENLQHSQRMKEMEIRSTQYALRLAQQNIDNQEKIILHQNSTIEHQTRIIERVTSKSVIIDSLENKEELEEVFEGFKVGKSKFLTEQVGVHLNPITALKTIGRRFLGKEDGRKSILGLDEEASKDDN